MRNWMWTSMAMAMAACGGSSDAPTTDAPPGAIDAAGGADASTTPDAMPTPFGCNGQPLPSSAPATITISGKTVAVNGTQTAAVSGVEVAAFVGNTMGTTATSGGSGDYAVSVQTGGKPVDAYVRARKQSSLDMYLYSAVPMSKDGPNATLVMVKQSDLDLLALGSSVTQSGSKGFVTVIVIDCLGNPVSGATVSVTPSTGATIRYLAGGKPSTQASATDAGGTALIFNAPAGTVTIGATADGKTLRAHAIDARAGVVTATVVQP